jgi:hypothetical protein
MEEVSMKEKEYDTLRAEIMEWQSRRFSVVTGSLVLAIGILGWAVSAPEKWSWAVVLSILFAMLTAASYLTWLMGLLNSSISTYLEVFHEECVKDIGWECRHRKFKRGFVTSKDGYATLYLGIGIISVFISFAICTAPPTMPTIITCYIFAASFVSMIMILTFRPRPWDKYIKRWKDIREAELFPPTVPPNTYPSSPLDTTTHLHIT